MLQFQYEIGPAAMEDPVETGTRDSPRKEQRIRCARVFLLRHFAQPLDRLLIEPLSDRLAEHFVWDNVEEERRIRTYLDNQKVDTT
jgi:hypothetical protein